MKLLKVECGQGNLKNREGLTQAPEIIVKGLKDFFLAENGKNPVFDVDVVKESVQGLEKTQELIYEKAKKILEKDELISVGGDHSITYPLFKSFSESKDNVGLVYVDAHADCEQGTKTPTYEDVLRKVISEGLVKPWNVILIGVRNWTENEKNFIKQAGIKFFPMKDVASEGLEETIESIRYLLFKCDNVYVSFDIDAVDPAFAPGTGWQEPGGFTSREAVRLVQALGTLKKVKALDVVECKNEPITAKLCSKLIFEFMAYKQ